MRSVAPESAGAAASQNNWFVVSLKPIAGRLTATTLHNCHTANARNKQGTEIHRLSRAIASPSFSQNALSSGVQICSTRPRCDVCGLGAIVVLVAIIDSLVENLERFFACELAQNQVQ